MGTMATARQAGLIGVELELRKGLGGFELHVGWSAGAGVTALFGFSGSGKTATLRMIAGLMRPDAGYVRVNGREYFDSGLGLDVKARRRNVGYVFQDYALFPHMSVAQNIAYGLRKRDASRRQRDASGPGEHSGSGRREQVARMIGRFGLEGLEQALPGQLSGGQKQRVALARALVGRPALLLLDEPFSALDLPVRRQARAVIAEACGALCIPTILVTHDFAEVRSLADQVVVYAGGGVVQTGSPEDVLGRPAGPEVKSLLGSG